MITGTRRNENPDEIGVSQSDASFCCQWSAMMQWLVSAKEFPSEEDRMVSACIVLFINGYR